MKNHKQSRDRGGKRQIGPLIDAALYLDIWAYCKREKVSFQDYVESALREKYDRIYSEKKSV